MSPAPGLPPGDHLAFEAFFREHYDRVVRRVEKQCDDPELAASEAFLRLYLRWSSVTGNKVAWITRVAKRKAVDQHTKAVRRAAAEKEWARARSGTASPCDDEALALLWFREAMYRLPERRRRSFLMRHFLRLDTATIAAELGITVACAEQELSRAKATLIKLTPRSTRPEAMPTQQVTPLNEGDLT